MSEFLRHAFPYGALLAVLAGASLFFGADTPMSAFLFSALLLLLGGVAILSNPSIRLPLAGILGAGFLGLSLIYDFTTGRSAAAMPDYAVLMAALAVYLTAERVARQAPDFVRLWQLMLGVFLAIAVWAFIDFALNPEFIHSRPRPYHQDRLSAAFLSANTAATFFGVVLIASAASILKALRKIVSLHPVLLLEALFRHATLGMVTFLFAAVCLLLTASRAGLAFALLSFSAFCLWDISSRMATRGENGTSSTLRLAGGAGLVLLLGGAFFWSLSGDVTGARIAELDEDANMRLVMFSAYWEAFLARPFTGYGFGSFSTVNDMIMKADNAHILATQGAAHNLLLQWLLQVGLVGTVLGALVLWQMIAAVWRGLIRRRRNRTYLRAILTVSLFVLLHGMVDFAVEIPGLVWWWVLLLGLGGGLASAPSSVKAKEAAP